MDVPMRRREQEVWQACDDLWAIHGHFKTLTGDAIRDRLLSLGLSKGSPNEIYKYRKTWEQSRGVSLSAPQVAHLGDDDPISRAVRVVHEKIQSEANDRLDNLKAEHETLLLKKDQALEQGRADLAKVIQ